MRNTSSTEVAYSSIVQSSLLLLRAATGPWRHLPCVFPEIPEHPCNIPSCIHVPVPDRTALLATPNSMDRWSCSPRCTPLTAHRNQLILLRSIAGLFPEAPVRTHPARPHLARWNNNRILLSVHQAGWVGHGFTAFLVHARPSSLPPAPHFAP